MNQEPKVKNAFVLAAGLGTRMGELTADKPKALLEVDGKNLISYALDHLMANGVESYTVNSHYFHEKLLSFFLTGFYGLRLDHLSYEEKLLETGGGILFALDYLQENFYVYNSDIISDINLQNLAQTHLDNKADFTMLLRSKGDALHVLRDDYANILAIGKDLETKKNTQKFQYTGIAVARRSFFTNYLHKNSIKKVGLTEILRDGIKSDRKILGLVHDKGVWLDVGTSQKISALQKG